MSTIPDVLKLKWGSELKLPSSRALAGTPHFIGGRYPCRSVAYIPRLILSSVKKGKKTLIVLDPFMGSGTTAIEAILASCKTLGVELDPYARLIATVSTTKLSSLELEQLGDALKKIAKNVKQTVPLQTVKPRLKNLEYWFSADNFDKLWKLRTCIKKYSKSAQSEALLLAALGDIIRACSKAERQSLKPYISKKFTKIEKDAHAEYFRIVPKYLEAVKQNNQNVHTGIQWLSGDATNFTTRLKVDIAITSPPYINAMDYTRCIKLESAWIGTADDEVIKSVKAGQLGEVSRRKVSKEDSGIKGICDRNFGELLRLDRVRYETALAYFYDMGRNIASVYRALRNGGKYFIIVGDSRLRGIDVPTHKILAEISKNAGFVWDHNFFYRIKDHRTSIPRGERGGKIEHEHVIGLTK